MPYESTNVPGPALFLDPDANPATRKAMRVRLNIARDELTLVYRAINSMSVAPDAELLAGRICDALDAIESALTQLRVPDLESIPDLDDIAGGSDA